MSSTPAEAAVELVRAFEDLDEGDLRSLRRIAFAKAVAAYDERRVRAARLWWAFGVTALEVLEERLLVLEELDASLEDP